MPATARPDRRLPTGASTPTFKLSGTTRDAISVEPWPLARGCYGDHHAALAQAIRGAAANPVPPWQAMAVMALMAVIELGHTSQREHRVCDAKPLQQG